MVHLDAKFPVISCQFTPVSFIPGGMTVLDDFILQVLYSLQGDLRGLDIRLSDVQMIYRAAPSFGFLYKLPYEYQDNCSTDVWDQLLDNVCSGDQERIIAVDANFTGRDMGSVISDIRDGLRSLPVPKDFVILFGGDYEEQQKAFRELLLGFIIAILLVYLVMAGQFESFRDPFVVLFSIPMAVVGIVVTMILTGTIFSMQAFIGCIMLAGIVVNNAIILVDYTNRLRREGLSKLDALRKAGQIRLRPILMTTSTTVLGLFPMALGLGEGSELRSPMAWTVIGGLVVSTGLTLLIIPVVYSLLDRSC